MKLERWQDLVDQIKATFEIEDEGSYDDDEHGGMNTQYLEFTGPLGRIRLEFVTKPLLLDTKTKYSKRIGSETKVEYVYSPTEKTYSLAVFKFDDATGEWTPFENNLFN
jgi:hypothetical protein